ncbi:hypothetical protein STTU_4001 [Streptomyces sp. Tu6071]|uniref:hypothetical protein n=1 Tax=unclassified Streptomyces TaxID=2593676 RepID=UPI00020E62D3|nr:MULTISPECIES: hypothetical protein [unclassified Streptomyces]ASY34455.1 hypothetical protein CAC01_18775 [Streptomyces sp. CLI2509]EGJ76790.1 hypothetical protein STTU_4001 [Streptomyces sp. Tu6071]
MARGGTGRGRRALVRVTVVVRAGAAPLWWWGVLAAAAGLVPPGLTGRRIGLYGGVLLYALAAALTAYARRARYRAGRAGAVRAARDDILRDRAVTVRAWRRGHRWWLVLAVLAALGSAFAVPAVGGLVLAGCGTGLWLKARWLGRAERRAEALYWLPADRLGGRGGGPVSRTTGGWATTGTGAGDAAPGGARRR